MNECFISPERLHSDGVGMGDAFPQARKNIRMKLVDSAFLRVTKDFGVKFYLFYLVWY